MSQFIEIFYGMETTPVKDYIDDSFLVNGVLKIRMVME